jgi:hypothetical protein
VRENVSKAGVGNHTWVGREDRIWYKRELHVDQQTEAEGSQDPVLS